jgi:hypothetical protein
MKTLVLLIYLFLIACVQKPSDHIKEDTPHIRKRDTSVVIVSIPTEVSEYDYVEKDYFFVIGGDTSIYSCRVLLNKKRNRLSIKYDFRVTTFSENDSTIIGEIKTRKKPMVNYRDQISDLRLLLKTISKNYNLDSLYIFEFGLSFVDGLSQNITENYLGKYGENFEEGSNKRVADMIRESIFFSDITKIVSSYNLSIDDVFIDALIYYLPETYQQDNMKNNKPYHPIIDCLVGFKIK